jgi:hypothetical protein
LDQYLNFYPWKSKTFIWISNFFYLIHFSNQNSQKQFLVYFFVSAQSFPVLSQWPQLAQLTEPAHEAHLLIVSYLQTQPPPLPFANVTLPPHVCHPAASSTGSQASPRPVPLVMRWFLKRIEFYKVIDLNK